MRKQCLQCNKPLFGRTDKKFCDDRCRSHYNYLSTNVPLGSMVRSIDLILKRNRRILIRLHNTGETKVSKAVLDTQGFSFDYYTAVKSIPTLKHCFFCYDIGYTLLSENEVLLVKQDKTAIF